MSALPTPFHTTTMRKTVRVADVKHRDKNASPEAWVAQRAKVMGTGENVEWRVFRFDVDPVANEHVGTVQYVSVGAAADAKYETLFSAQASIIVKVAFGQTRAEDMVIVLQNT